MANPLYDIPGLGGYMAYQDRSAARRSGEMDSQLKQMAMMAQIEKMREAEEMEANQAKFYDPQNLASFMTPGTPGTPAIPDHQVTPDMSLAQQAFVRDQGRGAPAVPGVAPQMDEDKALDAMFKSRIISPKDYFDAKKDLASRKDAEGFTLGEGQNRYDAAGTMIAQGQPKDDSYKNNIVTDNMGNITVLDNQGNPIKKIAGAGKPTAAFEKSVIDRKKMMLDMDRVIPELERLTKDGGLLDKATGSGIGAGVDWAAGMFGEATPGAIAIGQVQPIYDLVLKLVPRFEGPQSEKDVATYEAAAGKLSNPNTPNATKKAAAKEILRLFKLRRGQFVTKDYEGDTQSNEVAPPDGFTIDQ